MLDQLIAVLDLATLEIALGATSLISCATMLALWRTNSSEKGPACWAAATFLGGSGLFAHFFLLNFIGGAETLRVTLPFVVGSFPLALLLALEGTLRFQGIGGERKRAYVLPVFAVALLCASFLGAENASARYMINDPIMILILLLIAFFLLKRTEGLERGIHAIPSFCCIFLAATLARRCFFAFSGTTGSEIHSSSRLVYFAFLLWAPGWTCGLCMAVMFRARRFILKIADHDSLTGLANRRKFDRTADLLLGRKNSIRKKFALLLIDLNGLKQLNDLHGHATGDRALVLMSRALEHTVGPDDIAARFGGDEFVVLTREVKDRDDLERLEQTIRDSVEREHDLDEERKLLLRMSIGSALFPEDGRNTGELLYIADQRMYLEKQTRRSLSKVV